MPQQGPIMSLTPQSLKPYTQKSITNASCAEHRAVSGPEMTESPPKTLIDSIGKHVIFLTMTQIPPLVLQTHQSQKNQIKKALHQIKTKQVAQHPKQPNRLATNHNCRKLAPKKTQLQTALLFPLGTPKKPHLRSPPGKNND